MQVTKKLIREKELDKGIQLHQGDCIQLRNGDDLFQVIGVDNDHQRCWVRRWPLLPKGSPVFEVAIKQIANTSENNTECPLTNP